MSGPDNREWWELVGAKGRELGCGSSGGINWSWFYFDTEAKAIEFDSYARSQGAETRGVYQPSSGETSWGVRWR